MWTSTQRIGKDTRASSLFIRRKADVISEAIFTAMTGDRDDSRDGPQHDRSRSDTVMISVNFNSDAS